MNISDIIAKDQLYSLRIRLLFSNHTYFLFFSYIGSLYSIIFFYIFLLIFLIKNSYFLLFTSFLSLSLSTFIVFILKFTLRRKRNVRDTDHFVRKYDPYSFPSGHISRLLAVMSPFYEYSYFWMIITPVVFIVSIARIAKGYHYLLDCVAGALIGIISGLVCNVMFYSVIS